MKATLKDIAAEAGVSKSLVSMYLNGNPAARLSSATRENIDRAVRKYEYRRSYLASSLRKGRTATLGLVAGRAVNPYHAYLLDAALNLAEKRGYQVVITLADWDPVKEEKALESLMERQVDGILFYPSLNPESAVARKLTDRNFPIYFYSAPEHGFKGVRLDRENATRGMLREFRAEGIRKTAGVFYRVSGFAAEYQRISTESGLEFTGKEELSKDFSIAEIVHKIEEANPESVYLCHCGIAKELCERKRFRGRVVTNFLLKNNYFESPQLSGIFYEPFLEHVAAWVNGLIDTLENGVPLTNQTLEYCFYPWEEFRPEQGKLLLAPDNNRI